MAQCNAKTRKGKRCKATAVGTSTKCIFHGGKTKSFRGSKRTR